MKRIILLISILLVASNIFAQADTAAVDLFDFSLEDLMQMNIVSASKISQKATEAPAAVYVVTEEQIKMRGYFSLDELLEDIPQIEIQRKANASNNTLFSVNGIRGNEKFLVLRDGIRINSATGTSNTIGKAYTLANVKQVEVILGPASSLYGADAFSGIVNIITKTGFENKGIKVNTSYGMYNSTRNSITAGIGNEDISLSLTGSYYHSDEPFFPDYYPEEYSWYTHYQETGEMGTYGNQVKIIPVKEWGTPSNSYSAQARLTMGNFEIGYSNLYESHSNAYAASPKFYSYTSDAINTSSIESFYALHNFTSENEKLHINSTISSQGFKIHPETNFVNMYSDYQDAFKYENNRTIKIEEQLDYKFSEKFILLGGFSYEDISAMPRTNDLPFKFDETKAADAQELYYLGTNIVDKDGNDLTLFQNFYNLKYQNYGAFSQMQISLLDNKLKATLGGRYDYNSRYGATFNPRVGLVYNPTHQFSFKLLYGQAYLAPSPFVTYQHFGGYSGKRVAGEVVGLMSGFMFIPNPDLKPEERNSTEFHSQYQVTENFAITAHGYYSTMTNLITNTILDIQEFNGIFTKKVKTNVNEDEATAYGGTFRLDYRKNLASGLLLNFFSAYSYSDGDISGNPLTLSAKHTAKVGVGVNYKKKLNLYAKVLYRSGSYVYGSVETPVMSDEFYYVNLYACYNFIEKDSYKTSFFIDIKNVLNAKYYNAGGKDWVNTPQDPIKVMAGLCVEIF